MRFFTERRWRHEAPESSNDAARRRRRGYRPTAARNHGLARARAVDQRIAQVIGKDTKLKSLELGVQTVNNEDNWNRMSLLGPDQPVPPENSPFKAFDRVFKDFATTPDAAAKAIERDKTVLNAVS